MDTSGRVVLPPAFRKRDRRERNVPNTSLALPATGPALVGSTHPLPQRLPPTSAKSSDADIEQHSEVVTTTTPAVVSVDPIPGVGTPVVMTRAASRTSQTWTDRSGSNMPSRQLYEETVVDEATRAQLLDWFLRAGPMAQGLRDLKKWREGKWGL